MEILITADPLRLGHSWLTICWPWPRTFNAIRSPLVDCAYLCVRGPSFLGLRSEVCNKAWKCFELGQRP